MSDDEIKDVTVSILETLDGVEPTHAVAALSQALHTIHVQSSLSVLGHGDKLAVISDE